MTSKATAEFIRSDPDSYVQRLSVYDLRARKAASTEVYLDRAANSSRDFTRDEVRHLTHCSYLADKYFRDIPNLIHGVDASLIASIQWNFAKTADREYENGLPHTRGNVIFLSTNDLYVLDIERTTRTLIHEKVHVYQRAYPNKAEEYIRATGYKRTGLRANLLLVRANPDVDQWYYSMDGKACWYRYASEHPHSITDCIKYGHSEHPYEHMAYYVADLYQVG